jgi:hypothetical protein
MQVYPFHSIHSIPYYGEADCQHIGCTVAFPVPSRIGPKLAITFVLSIQRGGRVMTVNRSKKPYARDGESPALLWLARLMHYDETKGIGMEHQRVEYRGYVIEPMPAFENQGRYEGGYEISKGGKVIRVRRNIFPGSFYVAAAITDSIERAKAEIDNLVAMGS